LAALGSNMQLKGKGASMLGESLGSKSALTSPHPGPFFSALEMLLNLCAFFVQVLPIVSSNHVTARNPAPGLIVQLYGNEFLSFYPCLY
jgi:hypothetical protein